MSKLAILHLAVRELAAVHRVRRAAEPEAVMDDPQEVEAYTAAGRALGIMAPTYLFHTAQACEIIRPGDRVLDLACGPGTQLAQLAAVNPEARFVGVDLSREMLDDARRYLDQTGLQNVTLAQADIADLSAFADGTFDAVVSSMSLHHLPEIVKLKQALSETTRLLGQSGGIYFADFGRLKSVESMAAFAYRDADQQPEAFTRDYLNSLRAAFSVGELRAAVRQTGLPGRVFRMYPIPFMMAVKSQLRRPFEPGLSSKLSNIRDSLRPQAKMDLANMIRCFRLGGLRTRLLE